MDFSEEIPLPEISPLLKFINPPIAVENLEYQAILISQKNNKFFQYIDEKFKAEKDNLTIYDEKKTAFYNIRWVRPNEIFKEKFYFFAGPIKSSHVFQYQYENLHWVSCLCALSDVRNMLQKVFLQSGLSNEGIYSVFLHKNGQWKNIIIDDLFPINMEKYDKFYLKFQILIQNFCLFYIFIAFYLCLWFSLKHYTFLVGNLFMFVPQKTKFGFLSWKKPMPRCAKTMDS